MSVVSFLDYLLLEKNYSQYTIKAYNTDLNTFSDFIKEHYDVHSLKEVNYAMIRSWIITLSEKNISNRSINRKISSLNSYFKFLLKIEEISLNPLQKHKALKTSKKVQVPFSVKEIEEVIKLLEEDDSFEGQRNKAIIELFYSTGIRRSELINLKLNQLDLTNNSIRVLGKRNKERLLPLLPSIKQTLIAYISTRNNVNQIKDINHVFITSKGLKLYETLVYRIINNYFSYVSTKTKKSPHILRHSFATHLLNQGANLNAVKELLGHSSLAATQVYTHSSIAELKKVHGKTHPRSLK
ncbi:MAG: tyrosine-type recombinase/integrase [bacterium]